MSITARLAELGFQQHTQHAKWWVFHETGTDGHPIIVTVKLDTCEVVDYYHPADEPRALEIRSQAAQLLRQGA